MELKLLNHDKYEFVELTLIVFVRCNHDASRWQTWRNARLCTWANIEWWKSVHAHTCDTERSILPHWESFTMRIFGFCLAPCTPRFNGIGLSANLWKKKPRCFSVVRILLIKKHLNQRNYKAHTKIQLKPDLRKIDWTVVARNMIGWRKKARASCKISRAEQRFQVTNGIKRIFKTVSDFLQINLKTYLTKIRWSVLIKYWN